MGTSHHTHIVLNGTRYDAHSGKPIGPHPYVQAQHNMDNIKRSSAVSHQVHKTTERSKTLMRHAVKKPSHIKQKATMSDIVRPAKKLINPVNLWQERLDKDRLERAQKIKQSSLVSKFNGSLKHSPAGLQPITRRVEPLAVQPMPEHVAHEAHSLSLSASAEKLIAKGLQSAQSHTQPTDKKPSKFSRGTHSRRGRLSTAGALSLAAIMLGLFITYQNVPNLSMRYAATKAGVSAVVPGYRPSGFALSNQIEYHPGQVTLKFASNSDERSFTITQRASNWNSETLRNNYVANATDQIQTFEDKGRTIFLYGTSNATWVNGGVWYEIDGNSQLNSDQIIRIATSM